MKKRVAKILLKTFILLIIAFSIAFYYISNFTKTESVSSAGMKAVRLNSLLKPFFSGRELSRIKECGFNTVVISPKGYLIAGKIYTLPFTYSSIGFFIRKAHEAGLKVAVEPEVVVVDKSCKVLKSRLEKDFLLTFYQNWGQYLEKSAGEYLIISSSSLKLIQDSEESSWLLETLKEIKTYYSGKTGFVVSDIFEAEEDKGIEVDLLCLKGNLVGKKAFLKIPEVKGFDFVIFEIFPPQEAKNINLFLVDFMNLNSLLRKYSLRKGFGKVVYAGINLPSSPEGITNVRTICVTGAEQKVYLQKMLNLIERSKCDFILYDWDSKPLGVGKEGLEDTVRQVISKR